MIMMLERVFLLSAVLLLADGARSLPLVYGRRLSAEDDFTCHGGTEETLYYNLQIDVEGLGDGCDIHDLINIGAILEKAVDEVDSEIPDNENESMETDFCPVPIVHTTNRRSLRAAANKRRRKYRYRGSGKCRRCRKDKGDRLLETDTVSSICQMADTAVYRADLALAATQSAKAALSSLKGKAIECDGLQTAYKVITSSTKAKDESKEAKTVAVAAASRTRSFCREAKRATSDAELRSLAEHTAKFSDQAVKASDTARQRYFQIRDALDTNVCGQPIEVDGACSIADMATFVAELTETAMKKSYVAFLELRKHANECTDLTMAQNVVSTAKTLLLTARKALNEAQRKASSTQTYCEQVANAESTDVTQQNLENAERLLTSVSLSADRVRLSYLRINQYLDAEVCVDGESPDPTQPTPLNDSSDVPVDRADTPLVDGSEVDQTSAIVEKDVQTGGGESAFEDGEPEAYTPLTEWLPEFATKLNDRIRDYIFDEYHARGPTDREQCRLEGFVVRIEIEAVETTEKLTMPKDCETING